MSLTIRARFDGTVIVPDEPLDLPIDQPLELELTVPAPELLSEPVDVGEPATIRGTFALAPERKVLFTKAVELQTAGLPRREPHIQIDERRLAGDEQCGGISSQMSLR